MHSGGLTGDVSKNVCTDNIAFHCLFSVSMCLQSLVEDMCSVDGSLDQENVLSQVEYQITTLTPLTKSQRQPLLSCFDWCLFQKDSRIVSTYHPYHLHLQQIKRLDAD